MRLKLLFSKILEDEFSSGYLGRLRVLNQYSSNQKFIRDLHKIVHPLVKPNVELSVAATLALAAGVSLEQFVQKHSLLPFYRIVVCNDTDLIQGHLSSLNIVREFGVDVRRNPLAKFCPDCVREDNESRGYAYWRRFHQTPGVHWCDKHYCQLAQSPLGLKAFENPPSILMDAYYMFSTHEFSEVMENLILRRYVKIAHAFLELNRPISLIHAKNRMVTLKQRRYRYIRKSERKETSSLSEILLEYIPYCWLKPIYSELTNRGGGVYFNSIDNLALRLVNPMSYIIVLAYFFDSIEDSLKHWFDENEGLSEKY